MALYKAYCQNPDCGNEFEANRKDKKYCHKNCKNAHYRIRQQQEEAIEEKRREWEQTLRDEMKPFLTAVQDLEGKISEHFKAIREAPLTIARLEEEVKENEKLIKGVEQLLKFSTLYYYNRYVNEAAKEITRDLNDESSIASILLTADLGVKPQDLILFSHVESLPSGGAEEKEVKRRKGVLKKKAAQISLKNAVRKLTIQRLKKFAAGKAERPVPAWQAEISENENRIREINEKLKNPPVFEKAKTNEKKLVRSFEKKAKKTGKISIRDLRKQEFNTFTLGGDLGSFLGDIERNMMAVALTGNAGAGKSQFTFFLARIMLDREFTVMYFSLEEGIGQKTVEKADRALIEDDALIDFEEKASLGEVRAAAKSYDVVMIDSWQKLGAKSEEFDRLRQDFPKTIFIFIFQKTSGGKIRGGSMIDFDCSALIDVRQENGERVAFMVKSRYGTTGWRYNIDYHKVIPGSTN